MGYVFFICKLLWWLGVKEEKDGSWRTIGLKNEAKLRKDFWDTINNPKKVNLNLLTDDDVETYFYGSNNDVIMVIYVPMAKRNDEGWEEPVIEERFDPDRTVLSLPFLKKQAKKTKENILKIRELLEKNGVSKTSDVAEYLNLSLARTRVLLNSMEEVEAKCANSNRIYKLKN